MSTPFNKAPKLENFRLKLGKIESLISITGSLTDNLAVAISSNPGVKCYLEEGTPNGTTADTDDSQNSFGTLDDDAAPAVVGVLGFCGDAAEFYSGSMILNSVGLGGTVGTVSVATKKGSSSSGVTSTAKNIAVTFSLTGTDIDSAAATDTFWLTLNYRKI
jgi:hypothetical protein